MKLLVRIALVLGVAASQASVTTLLSWLFWYTADLPSVTELFSYNPASSSEIHIGANAVSPT